MPTRCPPMARFSIALVMPTTVWKMSRFATRWLYLIALLLIALGGRGEAAVAERDPLGVAVEVLALVGRGLDDAPELDRPEVAEQEIGADRTPQFAKCEVEPVFAAVGG